MNFFFLNDDYDCGSEIPLGIALFLKDEHLIIHSLTALGALTFLIQVTLRILGEKYKMSN